jgi:hypothetical protein
LSLQNRLFSEISPPVLFVILLFRVLLKNCSHDLPKTVLRMAIEKLCLSGFYGRKTPQY